MSEAKSGLECPGSIEEKGDFCDADESLSEDGSIHDSDDDFVCSDDEVDPSGLFADGDWDDGRALVDFVGLPVPREVLETWAKLTLSSLVGLKGSTLNSSLLSASRLLSALQSAGILTLASSDSMSTELRRGSLVLSPHPQVLLPATTSTPSTQPCQATTLSALATFMGSLETRCKASESIAFEVSASTSPLDRLCTQLALAAVISQLAREALK